MIAVMTIMMKWGYVIIDKKVILRCSSEDNNNETLPNQDKEGSQFMTSSLKQEFV